MKPHHHHSTNHLMLISKLNLVLISYYDEVCLLRSSSNLILFLLNYIRIFSICNSYCARVWFLIMMLSIHIRHLSCNVQVILLMLMFQMILEISFNTYEMIDILWFLCPPHLRNSAYRRNANREINWREDNNEQKKMEKKFTQSWHTQA